MPAPFAEVLRAHRRALVASQAPGLEAGWVFPNNVGRLVNGPELQKPLRRALKKAMITRPFTPHGFRHTFNNLLRQLAASDVVRAITGHSTERMTLHYSHVELHEKSAAVASLVGILEAGGEGGPKSGPRADGSETAGEAAASNRP
jgi:integrase